MDFTYRAYRSLLKLLRSEGYALRNYHDFETVPPPRTDVRGARCAILRHDIDMSLDRAVRMAELEAEEGVRSTWFVLLRTEFYNPASRAGTEALRRLRALGHEVGLHFDEASYAPGLGPEELVRAVRRECGILSEFLGAPVRAVSMHRPSRATLEADYQIPGIVNSYGRTFFREFKYLSDSRRRWREPVEEVIRSGEYGRLHILTHACWYREEKEGFEKVLGDFIRGAIRERYRQVAENVTDLPSILREEEIL